MHSLCMLVYAFVPLCICHVVCNSWSRLIAGNMPSAINLQSFAGGGGGEKKGTSSLATCVRRASE